MSKEEDQRFVTWDKAWRKWFKIQGFKLLAVIFPVLLPVVGIIPAYFFWRAAGRLHGPDLGKKPGRSREGTHDDLMKWMDRR